MGSFSLNSIVDINVLISPLSAPRPTFNRALFIGSTAVIPKAERLRAYEAADDLLTDGFANDDPEYLAALLYFSQSPAPDMLYIGLQDLTGTPETALEAITACRAKSSDWYVGVVLDSDKADHEAIAAWVEAQPATIYAFTTSDTDVPLGTADNIFEKLKGLGYKRTLGQYSTESDYAICALLGYAMGANTGLANSAYTLKFKGEVGVATEDLTVNERNIIEGNNGNLYLSYGNFYNIFEQGNVVNGTFFDEVLNLDMLVSDIQLNCMDLLYGTPKVPQTDAGQTQILQQVNLAADLAVARGFIAPGKWLGPNVLNLKYGDMLPLGYLTQSPPYSEQTQADRDARKSMPVYLSIKLAGAVHYITIGVYVNR